MLRVLTPKWMSQPANSGLASNRADAARIAFDLVKTQQKSVT
jgi:hypothetical protein